MTAVSKGLLLHIVLLFLILILIVVKYMQFPPDAILLFIDKMKLTDCWNPSTDIQHDTLPDSLNCLKNWYQYNKN